MLGRNKIWLILGLAFLIATALFIFLLQPQEPDLVENVAPRDVVVETQIDDSEQLNVETETEEVEVEKLEETSLVEEKSKELSETMLGIKQGKSSVLNLVFSDADLNKGVMDLLDLANGGETWANYAIGQIVDTCSNLHRTSEAKLIEMFSSLHTDMPPEQQNNMNELMPIVVDASKRCKSIDKDLISNLGGDARSWFRTGAEAGDANAYVVSGYTIINERLKAESNEYTDAEESARWKLGCSLKISNNELTPEAMINMSEHLNLFYDGKNKFKNPEAWVLLACQMGYENNCGPQSVSMKLKCMFEEGCQAGSGYEQGILYSQGQYELDQHKNTAEELRRIFENKEWDKLGF